MSKLLRVGDAVWLKVRDKVRPGVVLRVHAIDGVDRAFIACGSTGEPNRDESNVRAIVVRQHDLGFSELRLTDVTWFKKTFPHPVKADSKDVVVVGQCPDTLLIQIRQLYGFV